MKSVKSISVAAIAGLLSVSGYAGTQTIPFSFTPTGDVVLTFNQENISIGDVVSITVSVTMEASGGSLAADNDSGTESGSYTAEFGINADLEHSGGALALFNGTDFIGSDLSATEFQSGSLTVDDGDTIPTGGDGSTAGFDEGGTDYFFFALSPVSDSDSGLVDSGQWSNYLGTGTYDITISASQFNAITGVGGVATTTIPNELSGSVTVTVVPEPSVFALLSGACVLALAVTRRRS